MQTRKGQKPEWANLPRRRCDNCGELYHPFRPVVEGQGGFCQPNCRKEFHKHGGSFGKLKPVIVREVKARIRELRPIDGEWIERIETRLAKIEDFIRRLERCLIAPLQ